MEDKFYNLALRFLSYRPRSEKEVRDRLKFKIQNSKVKNTTQNSKVIDEIIQKLKEKKFINDEKFAKWFVESRIRFKPRSLRLIKMELKQKGIDLETINNLQLTINSDLDQAKKLAQERIERFKDLSKEEIYQKLGRFLASKGFNWDTIKKTIDETLKKGV
ncbi:MAG: regulatory protein RecX [Candidatus Levybacteria bacterium]|nr:regulatory protein RecX [Candidatus Levybacteria bacterium]